MDSLDILTIPGSLRRGSFTVQLVRNLQLLAPDDINISIFLLHDIPLYNQDIEDVGFPPPVQALRTAVENSDGIIFATPEYNGAMSGVLKNAIDWASRKGLLKGRPASALSGSPGALGATKAQENLRAVLNHMGMHVLSRPALAVPTLDKKLSGSNITDDVTVEFLSQWLIAFRDWILQLNK